VFGELVDVVTSLLCFKRKRLEDKVERLQTQNTETIRDKSAAENKSRNLLEKVISLEKENEGLNL
jgi:3-phenylpropionate/cinnamic acid dioxygenase small subunit